ncbi:hypothetical protein [Tamlana sp. I1]|uniref:hypothetical protein n=1 Tax=Tamlana sp. I1 TaxID=2762061 RepID=UPI00188E89E9|nr:hypothetical protein [Tamlana sp. I1]
MKLKINLKSYTAWALCLVGAFVWTSCQPDEVGEGNGLTDTNVDASFTVTEVEGLTNTFKFTSAKDVITSYWNVDGVDYYGNLELEVALPDAGVYPVTHTAVGRGGATNVLVQDVTVATSDPVAGNLIQGGKFASQDDYSKWTILNISDSGAAWTFNDGSATINASGWAQQGIYQAIEIEANKDYKIDMKVWGQGSTDTWFEVYLSKTPPVQGQEYTADGRRMGMSTWDGCATAPFEGKLSLVGCVGSGNIVSFDTAGTVYLVVRCGGADVGPTGISMTNVEVRGAN